MAIGTAALIIILSVYNGFDSLVRSTVSEIVPDLAICPTEGKVFIPEGEVFDWLYDQPSVKTMSEVLEENTFIDYEGRQSVATVRGVDRIYEEESPIREVILNGDFTLHRGEVPLASVGAGLAYELGINPRFVSPIDIYFPTRTGRISMTNPTGSLRSIRVFPGSTFSINSDTDNSLMIIPIEQMRELLNYNEEVSAMEIRLTDPNNHKELERIRQGAEKLITDGSLCIRDRYQQNPSLYKMLKSERVMIWMIMFFVIIIIAFNIFGSLKMLIIEKQGDIATLRYLGADNRLIRRIFIYEGWMISLVGMAAGLIIGIILCLIQQHFGIIKMPGNFIISAYPVILSVRDILLTAAGVSLIGYIVALIPSRSIVPDRTKDPMINAD